MWNRGLVGVGSSIRIQNKQSWAKNLQGSKIGQLKIVRGLSRRTAGEGGGAKRYRRCGVRKGRGNQVGHEPVPSFYDTGEGGDGEGEREKTAGAAVGGAREE